MLVVLLARGLTLPGAMAGVTFYLYPDPTRLVDPQVSYNNTESNTLSLSLPTTPLHYKREHVFVYQYVLLMSTNVRHVCLNNRCGWMQVHRCFSLSASVRGAWLPWGATINTTTTSISTFSQPVVCSVEDMVMMSIWPLTCKDLRILLKAVRLVYSGTSDHRHR